MIVTETRPTEEMVSKAYDKNKDGGGIAWRHNSEVFWKKGLDEDAMQKACHDLPTPYVAHFRVASSGGVRPELCHPFPVDVNYTTELEGRTKGYVLFHNGDWKEWRMYLLNAVLKSGIPLPAGKFNDSRAMAFCSAIYGTNFVEVIDEKGIVFSPDNYEAFPGALGWKEVNGVWCSNDYFWFVNPCMFQVCTWGSCQVRHGLNSRGRCQLHDHGEKNVEITITDTKTEPGGTQLPHPFPDPVQVVMIAEQQYKDRKISKKMLKRIRKAFNSGDTEKLRDLRSQTLT